MLYTRKGDNGTTKTFGCDQRMSKSSAIAEALGTLDEINSFLGICKVFSQKQGLSLDLKKGQSLVFEKIIHLIQENLFIVQAGVAGAEKFLSSEKVKEMEEMIDAVESQLPPIKTFFISGGSELAAHFDFARTLARRAERRVVAVAEDSAPIVSAGGPRITAETLSYLNRLSSLLYALARLTNHLSGINEEPPSYK